MTNDVFEIKISGREISPRALMFIKKKTNQSIAEVKTKINGEESFFSCALNDNKSLSVIINIGEYFQAENIAFETLYNGRVEDFAVLKNVLNSHRETAREVGLDEEDIDY